MSSPKRKRQRRIERRVAYLAYINGPEWALKRREALKHYGAACAECGTSDRTLHVHHLTYKRFGAELLEDLQVLCEVCHNAIHSGKKRTKKKPGPQEPGRISRNHTPTPRRVNRWLETYKRQQKEKAERESAIYNARRLAHGRGR